MEIINLGQMDLEDVIALNNTAIAEVNRLDRPKAMWLSRYALLFKGVRLKGKLAGFVVALRANSGYNSPYFGWFKDRFDDFIYIDRVVVANRARRRGLASALYRVIDQKAAGLGIPITTEVYCDPPNIPSLTFHRRHGFVEIGRQVVPEDGKPVAKLVKHITTFGEQLCDTR